MVKVKTTITVTYENFPDEDNEIVIETSIPKKYDYNVDRETVRRAVEDMQIYNLPIKCTLNKRSGSDFVMTDIYYDGGK